MGARPTSGRSLRFSKMHGAGNDFVVLDLRDGRAPPSADLCRALADRHVGVGCDQILTIEPRRSEGAVAAFGIWNADGSMSQQCGNGARCVAAWLVRDGVGATSRFMLDSPGGTHQVDVLDGAISGARMFRIALGVPRFAPTDIPLAGFDDARDEYPLRLERDAVRVGAVSLGNPHAVLEVQDADDAPVARFAPQIQASSYFPDSANVGFAQVVSRDRIRLRVFERGVGETLACGSGACAAAAVLMRRDRVDRDIVVSLPGGDLRVAWPRDDAQITLAGPAAFVFEGEWNA